MILIFNILFFAFTSMVIGGLFTKPHPITGEPENAIPRFVSLPSVFVVLGLQFQDAPGLLIAYLWLFYCLRILPTQALFTAVHGMPPKRGDWITKLIPSDVVGYTYGIWAGFIRTAPALPAMIYIGNPFLFVFFNIGYLYYLAGLAYRKYPHDNNVRYVEAIIGGLFGVFVGVAA